VTTIESLFCALAVAAITAAAAAAPAAPAAEDLDYVITEPPVISVRGSLLEKGYEACGAIKGKMELLLAAARSQCQPANDNGKIGIILASPLPAFRSLETKRAFFIAGVVTIGYEARRAGLNDFATLYIVDSDSLKTRDCYAMPIARASTLQQQTHDGKISGDAFVAVIMQEMRSMKMPSGLFGEK
jgi:hypothetical protein